MINFPAEYSPYIATMIGLLAIVNPVGVVPVFLSLCGDRSAKECHYIAKTSAFATVVILMLAVWVGDSILSFFGINIHAFKAGGGLLILLMAISMLHARQSSTRQNPEENNEASDKENISIVPLAIPVMAGPGSISLIIAEAHKATSITDSLFISASVITVGIIIWLSLIMANPIGKTLGTTGLNIITRVMGLLLCAIGIQMLSSGLVGLMPGLGGISA